MNGSRSECTNWTVVVRSGPLSPQHGTFWVCGWRKLPPATDISNKQSWKVDKGCPSSWGLGEGLTTPHSKNLNMLQIMHDSRLPAWHKWDLHSSGIFTQCRVVLLGPLDPWRWDRQVVPKCWYGITNLRCVRSQKSISHVTNCPKQPWTWTVPMERCKPHKWWTVI